MGKKIVFGVGVEVIMPGAPGSRHARRGRAAQVRPPGAAGDVVLPDDVRQLSANTYVVRAGGGAITVTDGRVILRRSGKSRQWARYLVGRVAGVLRTAIEVFLGYPSPEEIRAWLERLPGAEARAALMAWFEKLVDRLTPARLFAVVGVLAGLGRPALPSPVG